MIIETWDHGNESSSVLVTGKVWEQSEIEKGIGEIVIIVFDHPELEDLQLELPKLAISKIADIFPKTPFEVDYV